MGSYSYSIATTLQITDWVWRTTHAIRRT